MLPLHLGIHCHQPVENFYNVVDTAVEKSYLPFFGTVRKKSGLKVSVHYSGWLFEYIKKHHQNLFGMMKEASEDGQTEFFSGGFYEPVLASIPSRDRKEQIKKLSGFIEDNFKVSPTGLWLTERVWDSSIIPDCADCGIKYVIVDDYHFIASGFYENMLHGHFLTEQDGRGMMIFPISEKLRYMIPFRPAEDVVAYLGEVADQGGKSLTIFDDGEKFGLWPKTYEWVYEGGWLEEFIDAVEDSGHSRFALFRDTVQEVRPSQIAYLPTVSYFEMGEWSLFAERTEKMTEFVKETEKNHDDDTAKVFVKGGIWKNFLVKYPESNRIHKRALKLSATADRLKDAELYESLYKAQCNDALWHGIFGGLYLPNLRNNCYRFIIEGEKRAEELDGISYPYVETGDFDFDGHEEAYAKTKDVNFTFISRDFGQIISIDNKKGLFNFQNTLARRKEAYHDKFFCKPETAEQAEEESGGISTIHDDCAVLDETYRQYLVYDWHNKNSFVDHFVQYFDVLQFASVAYTEIGDFANQPGVMTAGKDSVSFARDGGLYPDGQHYPCRMKKDFSFTQTGLKAVIDIDTDYEGEIIYVLEMNLHFNDMEGVAVNGIPYEDVSGIDGEKFVLNEKHTPGVISIGLSLPSELFIYPVMTVSQSESGADLTRQGLCLLMPFRMKKSLKIECMFDISC